MKWKIELIKIYFFAYYRKSQKAKWKLFFADFVNGFFLIFGVAFFFF